MAGQFPAVVDEYSLFPPEVASLPKVGSYLAPNLETIVGLRPSARAADPEPRGLTAGAGLAAPRYARRF